MTADKIIVLGQEEIGAKAPAALRQKLSRNDFKQLGHSKKYSFFSTQDAINDMDRLGWKVVEAHSQKPQKKNVGKIETTTKHLIRFRNPYMFKSTVGGLHPEILITNAHDGTAAFKFHIGLFRLVCGNGMVIADRTFEQFKIRHMNTHFEEVRALMNAATERIPLIFKQINKWQKIKLDEKMQLKFATRALATRHMDLIDKWDRTIDMETLKSKYKPIELLTVQRDADKGDDMWHVFNRVQENLIKGNYTHYTKDEEGKNTSKKARSIDYSDSKANIRNSLLVNKGLWKLADHFVEELA